MIQIVANIKLISKYSVRIKGPAPVAWKKAKFVKIWIGRELDLDHELRGRVLTAS